MSKQELLKLLREAKDSFAEFNANYKKKREKEDIIKRNDLKIYQWKRCSNYGKSIPQMLIETQGKINVMHSYIADNGFPIQHRTGLRLLWWRFMLRFR